MMREGILDSHQHDHMLRSNYLLAALGIFLITIGCYSYALHFSFIIDDDALFQGQGQLGLLRSIPHYFTGGVWDNILHEKVDGSLYRPMFLVYASLLSIVFGNNSVALHAANIVLHAINSVLVFLIAKRIFSTSSWWVVIAGTLFFALHPAHVEPIAWISALTDLQVTFFILLSFLFYIAIDGKQSSVEYAISLGFFVLALFSKESAIVFPLVLIVYDYSKNQLSIKRNAVFWAAAGFYYACRFAALSGDTLQSMKVRNVDLEKALYLIKFIPAYFKQLIVPVDLPFFLNSSVLSYLSQLPLLSYGLVLGVFVCYVGYARKNALWAAVWFLAFLLPPLALAFCNMPMFAVRYLYLPSVGFTMVVTLLMDALYPKVGRVLFGAGVVLSVVFAVFLSYSEGQTFRDGITLGEKILVSSPESVRGHLFLAEGYENTQNLGMSLASLRRAYDLARIVEEKNEACYKLGLFLVKNNNVAEGLAYLKEAIKLNPEYSEAYNALGNCYLMQQDPKTAIQFYEKAVAVKKNNYEALYNLARSYEMANEMELAYVQYNRFIESSPTQQYAELYLYAENFVQRYRPLYGK